MIVTPIQGFVLLKHAFSPLGRETPSRSNHLGGEVDVEDCQLRSNRDIQPPREEEIKNEPATRCSTLGPWHLSRVLQCFSRRPRPQHTLLRRSTSNSGQASRDGASRQPPAHAGWDETKKNHTRNITHGSEYNPPPPPI